MNRTIAEILVLIIIAASWWYFKPTSAPVGQWTEPSQSKELKTVPTEVIQAKITIFKPEAKQKLQLPEEMIANKAVVVVSSRSIKPSERPITVTTTLDLNTNAFTTLQRVEPYPFFTLRDTKEVKIIYGLKGTERIGILQGSWELAQIKGWNIAGFASIATDSEKIIGGSLSYRW